MAVAVPCQRRHPIALLDAQFGHRMGQLPCPRIGFGIGFAVDVTLGPGRNDPCARMRARRVAQNLDNRERLIHHHCLHLALPCLLQIFVYNLNAAFAAVQQQSCRDVTKDTKEKSVSATNGLTAHNNFVFSVHKYLRRRHPDRGA